MYEPFSFDGFGAGLNLRDRADVVDPTAAIDLMNVVFTERGSVEQRPGYDNFTASALTNAVASLEAYYKTDGTRQLLAGCGTRLEAINTSGAIVASQTGLTTGIWDFCRFGAPGSEVAYAGNGANLLYKWNGSAWASVANTPKARYLAVMAVDQGNRLVAAGTDDSATAGPGAIQSYTDRVWFSDAGAPETWGANNYVSLTPGDGEKIQGVVAWREMVIVFKETKFFVFTGTDTDSEGSPVFRYYTVEAGIGLASPRAYAVSPKGIYFMARDGVYFTNGGDPEQVSDMIDAVWTGVGGVLDYYTGGTIAHSSITNCAMTWFQERLYLAFPTSSANNRILVYDPRYDWWSLWNIPASCLTSFRVSSQASLVFGYASGSNDIGRVGAYTNDDGSAIESYWRSGWVDCGLSSVKTSREVKFWGDGKVCPRVDFDFAPDGSQPPQIDMTSAVSVTPTAARRRPSLMRTAVRGTVFSLYLYNNTLDQEWTLARANLHLRETKVPSVKRGTGTAF